MKKLLAILTLFSLFFLISCAKDEDDGAAVGGFCLTSGEETCSTDSSEILVCKDSLWESKKSCRTYLGEYCRQTASGSYSCTETDIADSGDSSEEELPDTADSASDDTDTTDTTPDSGDSQHEDTDVPDSTDDSGSPDQDDSGETLPDNDTAEGDNDPAEDSDIPQPADEDADIPQPADEDTDTPDEDTAPVDPCDPNPCAGKTNSTEICTKDGENYTCGCIAGYEWKGASCEATEATKCSLADGTWNAEQSKCTKTVQCSEKPANTEWNDGKTESEKGKITQTLNGTDWLPVLPASVYSEETGDCHFKCDTNYFWKEDETKCVNPCDPNPCSEIANTNDEHTCTPTGATTYECGCKDSYFWKDGSCVNPCEPDNPCTDKENTDEAHTCTPKNATEYKCTCKNDDYFWADEKCRLPLPLGNICTEQSKCYNTSSELEECPASASGTGTSYDFFGQDAQYAELEVCAQQKFSVETASNGEKFVFDHNTGLEWTQNVWENVSKADVATTCPDTYADLTGWRLPTPQELLTITNVSMQPVSGTVQIFDKDYFPNVGNNYLWSTQRPTTNVYYYLKTDGSIANTSTGTSDNKGVICVRGKTLPLGNFSESTINDTKVVIDSTTGLMWQKTLSATSKSWQEALEYCETGEGSNYAGYSDWRLPNRNELASLLDHTDVTNPMTAFPDMTSSNTNYWTSTTHPKDLNMVFTVNFSDHSIKTTVTKNSTVKPKVFCVRNAE